MADIEELVQCPPGYKLGITNETFQALEGLVERKKTHIELVMNLTKIVWSTEHLMLLKSSALVLWYAVLLGFILIHERICKQIAQPLTENWGCSRVWLFYYWIALYGGFLCMLYPVGYILSY